MLLEPIVTHAEFPVPAPGLPHEPYSVLPKHRPAPARTPIGQRFAASRPHSLIDTRAALPAVNDDIPRHLACRPAK